MIQYDNANTFYLILQLYGSAIPRVMGWAVGASLLALVAALHRQAQEQNGVGFLPFSNEMKDPLGFQIYGLVLGYVVVFRTNMAVSRYMEGITTVQIMLSKWGDAFMQLVAFMNSSLEAPSGTTPEQIAELLALRMRCAHWFAMMSACAMHTLQREDPSAFDFVVVKPEYGQAGDSHRGLQFLADVEWVGLSEVMRQNFALLCGSTVDISAGKFWVFREPTQQELRHLETSPNKVMSLMNWITEAVMVQKEKGHLKTPEPILSRCFQELGIGMRGYYQSRKIAQIPFPYPFAQMLAMTLVGSTVLTPVAMDMFTQDVTFTVILTFVVTLGFWGLNQLAVELEDPYGGEANDLPLASVHNEFVQLIEDLSLECPGALWRFDKMKTVENYVWSADPALANSSRDRGSIESYMAAFWPDFLEERSRAQREAHELSVSLLQNVLAAETELPREVQTAAAHFPLLAEALPMRHVPRDADSAGGAPVPCCDGGVAPPATQPPQLPHAG
eukprot:CAMPEP_0204342208 /NCGR_PEP_ID=MMETSP0469-20131031/23963_1 /ASSEMBLY_ACC=CAM_ASM_000384 /TAXON_ID=2969 /ORGANISM="Oxyrrhis marina" /LENGTH=501 /DNA_ID=CAMNT_0051327073 /DNA_START=54 /DNA_END=1559 /DNA_ORIENTATION=-